MVENKEGSDPMASAIDKLKPLAAQVSFGSIMGFCSGYALKKAGKVAAVIIGTGFVALQTASSYGYIKMDWKKISDDAMKPLDTTGDGKVDIEDLKIWWKKLKVLLTANLPGSGGFSLGFLYGVKSG